MAMDKAENGYETMLERGEIILNGYHFFVKPIKLKEESQYFSECRFLLYPKANSDSENTEQDLNRFVISIFLKEPDNPNKPIGLVGKLKRWFREKFIHNYKYYSDVPGAVNLVKWIEKKVSIDGKPVRFYDLEEKYQLRKHEIAQLIIFFHDISGFR